MQWIGEEPRKQFFSCFQFSCVRLNSILCYYFCSCHVSHTVYRLFLCKWSSSLFDINSFILNQGSPNVSQSGHMSQASSSPALTRRSSAARVAQQPGALAVVEDTTPLLTVVADLEAPIDTVTALPLIICPNCRDVRVFAATTTRSQYNNGKRYFKYPRKNFSILVQWFNLPKVHLYF